MSDTAYDRQLFRRRGRCSSPAALDKRIQTPVRFDVELFVRGRKNPALANTSDLAERLLYGLVQILQTRFHILAKMGA